MSGHAILQYLTAGTSGLEKNNEHWIYLLAATKGEWFLNV